jgi:major membrane immunogen (membrane-anchored lipoprotein)
MKRTLGVLALLILLSACGESPQAMTVTTKDGSPYAGTGKAFTDPGWKQGDKASWESHLKARSQYGQNDYTRIN